MLELTLSAGAAPVRADPVITWMSEPVAPGDVVLVYGGDLAAVREVAVSRIPDGDPSMPQLARAHPPVGEPSVRSRAIQPTDHSLKFVLPPTMQRGLFAIDAGGARQLVGLPRVEWAQQTRLAPGIRENEVVPGALVQIIGRNFTTELTSMRVVMRAADSRVAELRVVNTDKYSVIAEVPATLRTGDYTLWVHNGSGGSYGWGGSLSVRVRNATQWPTRVFNVRDFGARGDNVADDSDVFRRVLQAAERNRGGVVYFPAGTYRLAGSFRLPRRVSVRGEGKDITWLKWPLNPPSSVGDFIPAALTGGGEYAIEQLSLMVRNAKIVLRDDSFIELARAPAPSISPGFDTQLGQDIFIRQVAIHYLPYAGRASLDASTDPQWAFNRWGVAFDASLELTIALGGIRTIEISDCDFIGTQRFLDLKNGRITRNHFRNPMNLSWTDFGGQHLVFERNTIDGASSWRMARLPLRHIYGARNVSSNIVRGEREAMTLDLGKSPYLKHKSGRRIEPFSDRVSSSSGRTLTLASSRMLSSAYRGFDALIVSGRGAGQYRSIEDNGRGTLRTTRDWDVQPDASSVVLVHMLLGHCIFHGNTAEDTSVLLQIWGAVYDCTIDDNTAKRSGGMWALGGWFIQWLGNRLETAVTFHTGIGPAGPTPEGTADYGLLGFAMTGHWLDLGRFELARGTVIRKNVLSHGHRILAMWGYGGKRRTAEAPLFRDFVVDQNTIAYSPVGIELDANVMGAVLAANTFTEVNEPLRLHAPERVEQVQGDSTPMAPP